MLVFQAEHNILITPSTCWELVSSVVHCSRRRTVHWLPLHWFVKPLKLSPRTMVTSSVKKKRLITLLQLMDISDDSSSNISFNNSRSLHFFLALACHRHLVHGTWRFNHELSISTDSTSINPLLRVKVEL